MKSFNIFGLICILIIITSCSGINLSNNCGKPNVTTFIVLPFVDDNYGCHLEVENKIRNLCYNVSDGYNMLNEYARLSDKNYSDIEINEFCDYAKSKGIDYVVVGKVHIKWYEGRKPTDAIIERPTSDGTKSLESEVYYMVTGNYAVVNCYSINTVTKVKQDIFRNYKVKKVQIGLPVSKN